MITKQQASVLYGNNYKLQDKNKKLLTIVGVSDNHIIIEVMLGSIRGTVYADYESIGDKYFILASNLEQLTQTITHDGEEFIPIVELAKVAQNAPELEKFPITYK